MQADFPTLARTWITGSRGATPARRAGAPRPGDDEREADMEQDDARGENEADSPAAHSDGVDWDAMATVGTAYPAGRAAEFGTLKRPATPWLWPILRARLPAIKYRLRKLALAPLKIPPAGV